MDVIKSVSLSGFGRAQSGKVRDYYITGDKRILIATDRVSAFDNHLGYIPNKGAVLTQLSVFWFTKTTDIIQNHFLCSPDPNVMIVKNCTPIPIEMVVRGYITGVTATSLWGAYQRGERVIYGIGFPNGLRKNQKLPSPIITPTTKATSGHDQKLTHWEIMRKKIVPEQLYAQMEKAALLLFERGTDLCDAKGIILVDTKYEFGLLDDQLVLIDELHTPDSSRFWLKSTYQEKFEKGEEQDNYDKEFLRLWYVKQGYKGDGRPPALAKTIAEQTSKRYIKIYEMLTNRTFVPQEKNPQKRIARNLKHFGKPKRLAVLVSNRSQGTNLQAIIDAIREKKIFAKIAVVVSDAPDAMGIVRAKKYRLPTLVISRQTKLDATLFKKYALDYVLLAGWKQVIPNSFLKTFHDKVLNVHPGLIPDTPTEIVKAPDGSYGLWNKGMFMEKAVENFLLENAAYAGSSVHIVTNSVDFGPVLARSFLKVESKDTVDTLYQRLKAKEHEIYIESLQKLCNTW